MALNLRQKQSDALLRMLNLHTSAAATRDASDLYKILVLDRFCKDVVAPLLRVSELRKQGVTLHLMLETERQPVTDVPAIYFMQPTPANIDRVAADAGQGLYDAMHLNFVSAAPARLLEQLAAATVKNGGVTRISKLFDEYLSFVALEPSLFTLGLPQVYVDLNHPAAKDTQIEACVTSVVDGLFSVLVTLGVVPIIRCPKGGAAEAVAAALEQRLRDALKGRSNLFSEGAGGGPAALAATLSRPLLVLFDRNMDLSCMLQHSWTYKPLVQDVLGLKLNRVTLPEAAGPGGAGAAGLLGGGKKGYDVDDKDFFWEMCGAYPFPKVAEEVEVQLQKYKAAVTEINAQTGGSGAAADVVDHDEVMRRNTQHLMAAVSSLPELQERKKVLDKHTNLATALLGAIKERGIDALVAAEEEAGAAGGKPDWPGLMRLVQGTKGAPTDKLRLLLVALLAAEPLPPADLLGELRGALAAAGCPDTRALDYLLHLRRNRLVGPAGAGGSSTGVGGSMSSLAGGVLPGQGGALLDWADKTLGSGLTQVTRAAKNLLAGGRVAPLVAAVEALMEGKQGTPEFDTWLVLDPKLPPGRAGLERAKGPFREALVFGLGGGSYAEREALTAWAGRATPQKQVLYGATDLLSGPEFLQQLEELATASGLGGSSSSATGTAGPGPAGTGGS